MSLDVSFPKYVKRHENVDIDKSIDVRCSFTQLAIAKRHRRRARIQLPRETLTRRRASRTTVELCFGVGLREHRLLLPLVSVPESNEAGGVLTAAGPIAQPGPRRVYREPVRESLQHCEDVAMRTRYRVMAGRFILKPVTARRRLCLRCRGQGRGKAAPTVLVHPQQRRTRCLRGPRPLCRVGRAPGARRLGTRRRKPKVAGKPSHRFKLYD